MKVIAISGSPRVNGNTDTLLKESLEIISSHGIETEFISLAGKNILTCTACMGCTKKPHCVLDDDFEEVFQEVEVFDKWLHIQNIRCLVEAILLQLEYVFHSFLSSFKVTNNILSLIFPLIP